MSCSKVCKIIPCILILCISFPRLQAQWSGTTSVNTPVAVAPQMQWDPKIVGDGSGGQFIAWRDFRSGIQNVYLQHLNSAGLAQWAANGIKVVSVDADQAAQVLVSDGAGGVIIAWTEDRSGNGRDVYAQRFNGAGTALWTPDGVVLTGTGNQQAPVICSDGNNGAFICFDAPDAFAQESHMFGQWVDANGVVKWGTGVELSNTLSAQNSGVVTTDGAGGAIYAWYENRTGPTAYNVYAQRIDASGTTQWGTSGAVVAGANGNDLFPNIINDGGTGAFITWEKNAGTGDIWAQHINNSGASLWTANGVQLLSGAAGAKLTGDGGTGFHITWRNSDVRTQHYNNAGTAQWTGGGVVLGTGMLSPNDLSVAFDGTGGLYAVWSGVVGADMYLYGQYVDNTGAIKFAAAGILLSNAPGNKIYTGVSAREGMPGATFVWQDERNSNTNSDIFAQLLLPTGLPPDPPPTIQSFTPASGPAGTSVTITGYGFDATASNNIVYFDGIKATVTAATPWSLTVTVPAHITYAQLSVLNTVTNMRGHSRGFYSRSNTPVSADMSKYDFLRAQTFSITGGLASKVATADLDGNGKPDVVACNSTSGWVSIFGNSATPGAFGATGFNGGNMNLNTNGKIEHISISDLDNDGRPDLVLSDWQNNKIYIFRNESTSGNFSFGNMITLTVSNPFATVITDVNGDGKNDIVAANLGGGTIYVFQNSATPGNISAASFSAAVGIPVSGGNTMNLIAAGDLDGDGKDDLLVGDGGSGQNKMYVLKNTHTTGAISTSSFGSAIPFTVGASADGLAAVKIADMDLDGKPDILGVTYSSSSVVGIYRNISTPGTLNAGSFAPLVAYNSGGIPYDMAIGDIDGDAKPEIAVVSVGTNSTWIFKNFSTPGTIDAGSFSNTFAIDNANNAADSKTVVLADMDGDGRSEIVGSAGNGIGVFYQSPLLTPTAQATNLIFTFTGSYSGNLGWTNGDGAARMVFVKTGATSGEPVPVDFTAYNVSTSVAVGGQIGSSGWRAVYIGTGNSTFINDLQPGGAYRMMVVELNNNGYNTGKFFSATATGNPANITSPVEIFTIGTVDAATHNLPVTEFVAYFTGDITGLTAANFALSTTGVTGAAILSVTGSGNTFNISVSTGSGDGTIGLNLVNSTGLSAPVSTPLPYEGYYYTIDKTGPALTPISIASNNSLSATYARVGQAVSVRFRRPGEAINAVTASIAGYPVTMNNSGADRVGSLTITSAIPEGPLTFTVSADDYLGNRTTANQTTNGSFVIVDKTLPTFPVISIQSSNAMPTLAKVGDVITLNYNASEPLAGSLALIAGQMVTVTSTGGNGWKAVYTVTGTAADGVVPILFNGTDWANNASATQSATTNGSIVTIDKTAPLFTSISIVSDNAEPGIAKPGNKVTLRFTSSEPIAASTVTLGGQALAVTNTGGNNWEGSRTINLEPNGIIPFTIQANDLAGNASQTANATTNSSSVRIDNTAPLFTAISIVSDNTVPGIAKPGNKVTLRFTSDEAITPATITLAGQALTVTNTGGNNWEGSRVFNSEPNGIVSFSIRVNDIAGNTSQAATATTNSTSVLFDKTAPVLSNVTIASGNADPAKATVGDVVKINFTASETIATPTVTIATHNVTPVNTTGNVWTAAYTLTASDADGLVPFSIAFADIAGNAGNTTAATTNSSAVTFSKNTNLPATLTSITLASGNPVPSKAKTGDRIMLKFISDVSLSGVTATIATHAISPVNTTGNTWSAVYTMTASDAEGKVPFTIVAANLALTATGSTDGSNVWFDRTLPIVNNINRQSPATANVTAGPLVYRVQFSEPVNGVEKRNFRISKTATAGAAIDTIIHTNDSTYDVRLTNLTGTGTLRLDLDTTGNIADSAGNMIITKYSTGQLYNVAVPVNSVPVFVAGSVANASVCQNTASLDLSDLLRTTDADNGQTLTWRISGNAANGVLVNFPATALSNGSVVTPPTVGYTPSTGFNGADQFVIKVSDGTDSAMITVKITVYALPSENITAAQGTILCGPNASLPLSIANGSSFSWTRNGTVVTGTSSQLNVTAAGTYAAVVTDANGCTAATGNSIVVTTAQQPKAAFVYNGYCMNIPVSITNQSTGTSSLSYQWSDGNGNISAAAQPSFTYTQPGNYTVKLKVSSSVCPLLPDSLSQTISIERPAAATRMSTINAQVGQQVQLQARTFGTGYQWTPANDLTNSAIANPVLRARAEQQYTVSIKSAAGCTTVDTLLVKVFENTVYVPRVFTPNGDGNNDVLYFNYINVRKLDYARIYNRQGKLVWESTNMADGWDGKFNGALQPLETYTWVIRATDIFGLPVNRQGNVTLLR